MNINYTISFMIASAIKGLIIYMGELFKFTTLGINFAWYNIIVFFLAGQFFGYLFLYIHNKYKKLKKKKVLLLGSIFGVVAYMFFIVLNVSMNVFKNPLSQGLFSIIIPLIAFIIYGILTAIVVKNPELIHKNS